MVSVLSSVRSGRSIPVPPSMRGRSYDLHRSVSEVDLARKQQWFVASCTSSWNRSTIHYSRSQLSKFVTLNYRIQPFSCQTTGLFYGISRRCAKSSSTLHPLQSLLAWSSHNIMRLNIVEIISEQLTQPPYLFHFGQFATGILIIPKIFLVSYQNDGNIRTEVSHLDRKEH